MKANVSLRCVIFTLLAVLAARAPAAEINSAPYANELNKLESQLKSLALSVQVAPDPAELSPAKPGVPPSVTTYAEARISDDARDKLNAQIAAIEAAVGGLTADGLADVDIIETIRWTVNGMAWGAPLARRVNEVAPVLGRASLQLNRVGPADVEAEIEWRIELRRGAAPAAAAGAQAWSWVPWGLDLPATDPRQAIAPLATRVFLTRGKTAVAIVAPSAKPLPASIRVEGPVRAYAGAEVKLQAILSIQEPGPDVRIEWMAGKNIVGVGDTLTFTPGMPGPRFYVVRAVSIKGASKAVLAQQKHMLDVLPPVGDPKIELKVSGANQAGRGSPVVLTATLRALNRPGSYAVPDSRVVWSIDGKPVGEGNRFAFSANQQGMQDVVATVEHREGARRDVVETVHYAVTFGPSQEEVLAAQKAAAEKAAADEAAKQAQIAADKAAAEKAAAEKAAAEKAAAEKAEQERQAKLEAEKVAAEKAAAEKAALEKAAAEKAAAEKLAAEKAAADEAARKAKIAEEKAAAERAAELERQAKLKAEQEAAEKAAAEKLAAEKAAAEKAAAEEAERQAKIKAEQEAAAKAAQEKADHAARLVAEAQEFEAAGDLTNAIVKLEESLKVAPDKFVSKHIRELHEQQAEIEAAAVKAEAEKKAAEEAARKAKLAEEKAAAERAVEQERQAKIKAEQEAAAKVAAEKAEQERLAKLAAEKAAAEKAAAEKAAAEKAAAEESARQAKLAAEKAAAEKAAAEKAAAEKAAAEAAARQKIIEQAKDEVRAGGDRESKGDLKGALAHYKAANELAPDEATAAKIKDVQERIEKQEAQERAARERAAKAALLEAEARQFEDKGDLTNAIAKYEASIALVPDAALAKRLEAVRGKQAKVEAAEKAAREAAEEAARQKKIREDKAAAAVAEAKSLEDQGDYKGAIAKLIEATGLAPDEKLSKHIDELRARQAAADAAAAEARANAEKAKKSIELAKGLIEEGQLDSAIAEAKTAAGLDPKSDAAQLADQWAKEKQDAIGHIVNARAAIEKWDYDAAMAELQKAQEKHPRFAPVMDLQIEVAELKHKAEQAKDMVAAANALEKKGDLDGAKAKLEASLKIVPDAKVEEHIKDLHEQMVQAELKAQSAREAADKAAAEQAAAAQKAAQEQKDVDDALAAARKSLTEFDTDGAEAALEKARSIRPKDPGIAEVEQAMAKAKKDVETSQAVIKEGYALESQGELEQAVAKYEAALDMVPDEALQKHLADVRKTLADEEVAEKAAADEARAMLAQQEKEAVAKLDEAKELVAQGKLEEGAVLAAEASRLDPLSKDAATFAVKWSADRRAIMEQIVQARTSLARYDVKKATIAWQAAKKMHPKFQPVVELGDDIEKLRKNIEQAQVDINDGFKLEKNGDVPGAMAKYENALALVPDAKISTHLAELKGQQGRVSAQQLVNDGYKLEQGGDTTGAIAKYEEALKLAPDDRLSAKVAELKKQ